jgi:hypothetical protein
MTGSESTSEQSKAPLRDPLGKDGDLIIQSSDSSIGPPPERVPFMRAPGKDTHSSEDSLIARVRELDISSENRTSPARPTSPDASSRLPVEQRSKPNELPETLPSEHEHPEYERPETADLTEAEEQWKAQYRKAREPVPESAHEKANKDAKELSRAAEKRFMAVNPDDPSEYRYEFDGGDDISSTDANQQEEEDYHVTVDGYFESRSYDQPRRQSDAPPKLQKNNKLKKKESGSKFSTFVWVAIVFGLFYVQFCIE